MALPRKTVLVVATIAVLAAVLIGAAYFGGLLAIGHHSNVYIGGIVVGQDAAPIAGADVHIDNIIAACAGTTVTTDQTGSWIFWPVNYDGCGTDMSYNIDITANSASYPKTFSYVTPVLGAGDFPYFLNVEMTSSGGTVVPSTVSVTMVITYGPDKLVAAGADAVWVFHGAGVGNQLAYCIQQVVPAQTSCQVSAPLQTLTSYDVYVVGGEGDHYVVSGGVPAATNVQFATATATYALNLPKAAVSLPTIAVSASVNGLGITLSVKEIGGASPYSYSVNWDDGTVPTTVSNAGQTLAPTHVYSMAGNYTINVTVTDDLGAKASDSVSVSVSSNNDNTPPPVGPFGGGGEGLSLSFGVAIAFAIAGAVALFFALKRRGRFAAVGGVAGILLLALSALLFLGVLVL